MLPGRVMRVPSWAGLSRYRRNAEMVCGKGGNGAMTCCNGSATWECVYPDPCSCGCPCCQGSNCSAQCNSTNICGVGGCCTCSSGSWMFAWKINPPACNWTINCGGHVWFSNDCNNWYGADRCDTHQQSASSIADLTKALFLQFAPLSQGVISNMRVSNTGCC